MYSNLKDFQNLHHQNAFFQASFVFLKGPTLSIKAIRGILTKKITKPVLGICKPQLSSFLILGPTCLLWQRSSLPNSVPS